MLYIDMDVLQKAKGYCARNSGLCLALIVALVAVLVYMIGSTRGWFPDYLGADSGAAPAKSSSEIDKLIESIEA